MASYTPNPEQRRIHAKKKKKKKKKIQERIIRNLINNFDQEQEEESGFKKYIYEKKFYRKEILWRKKLPKNILGNKISPLAQKIKKKKERKKRK